MLDKIIYFSIKNKLLIGLLVALSAAWGVFSFFQLPIDAVPDITNNQVQIVTRSPSLAAEEVEKFITYPVEQTMVSIPEMEEVRSISRFGLSVVTLVFKEDVEIYWARQQVFERLQQASNNIPAGLGIPELMPVTTGLGEIYQYVIRPEKGYESRYNATELRTIQDWVVRRQLLGTPGVADVSSFGGFIKQYEVAVVPEKLRSMDVSIDDLFNALEKNNQNTGGAYIDKNPDLFFIRSIGLVGSLSDIEKIVVKNTSMGIPIYVKDLAEVRFGHAVRYGAMTRNTEGEVVGAIVMMLKGENSSQVIKNVKERIGRIQSSLPEGIVIEPFLDRTKLVDRAINTVAGNLIEGALIVIFVLVLLLGNIRAGLLVASVIPLSMLFAISMMNVFGISGNLMSLGAIDFGLIVDGAVIIVEATLHHLSVMNNRQLNFSRENIEEEVYKSASGIRTSAAFGEIIILIVYLPLLALTGVEGKMFKPMAQTVSFAIIGAFILSLTYVPMMSALILKPSSSNGLNFSEKVINYLKSKYQIILVYSLRFKSAVISITVLLFIGCSILFARMGGEFIPTLDEGDFAVEVRLLPGSSLSHTIETTNKAAQILLSEFTEVREVIGKIGTAEIPTDPMPMEACDLMIILKDKSEWKVADSREELAEKMAQALDKIPGVNFSFQQPIQMRFNELMTGAKQDVSIKIFGDDLEKLESYSSKIQNLISGIDGIEDVYKEQILGLPQLVIKPDREKIARYGTDIESVNRIINTAFAGASAGVVYEGEKRFELVIRLSENSRNSSNHVRSLFIPLKNGTQVPIEQLAEIEFRSGPNQIQREDAKRRTTVSFNVRGRDVESVVNEIKKITDSELKLEPGYFIEYGGTFKNLIKAKERLSIVVPISLLFIFILLYWTFQSFTLGLMIFTAIPMSAIGGILALIWRDMPFSISAGVGFIALFGVSVLNGIVLIAEFNKIKKSGIKNIHRLVISGADTRFRPVIMTALVASLGFLPMALSTGAGAEVQKPLATVVIGGLVTSTILTLLVLPSLYSLVNKIKSN